MASRLTLIGSSELCGHQFWKPSGISIFYCLVLLQLTSCGRTGFDYNSDEYIVGPFSYADLSEKLNPRNDGSTSVMDDEILGDTDKRHMGAIAKFNSLPMKRGVRMEENPAEDNTDLDMGESSYSDFPDPSSSSSDYLMDPASLKLYPINDGDLDLSSQKNKRFLGTMARGGWFPRHFRGRFVGEGTGTYEKRYIGSVARTGFLPSGKRNIQSLKKTQYGSPSTSWTWGRQINKYLK